MHRTADDSRSSRLLDHFIEARESVAIDWTELGSSVRRGWRSGRGTRRRGLAGAILFESRDSPVTELGSIGSIGRVEAEDEVGRAVDWVERSASATRAVALPESSPVEIAASVHLYHQRIRHESPRGEVSDDRSGVRIEIRARMSSGASIARRLGARTLGALTAREDAEAFGRSMGEDLSRVCGPPARPTGLFPVVFDPRGCGALVHELGHQLETGPGPGPLLALGERVGSRAVSIVEDPSQCSEGRGAFQYDDEGRLAGRALLIGEGVVTGHLRSLAPDDPDVGVGQGRRASYRDLPLSRMGCTILEAGGDDPEAIVRGTERGLLVRTIRGGDADPGSGRITLVVEEGFLIEGGRPTRPLAPGLIMATAREILESIDAVGSDLRFDFGSGNCVRADQQVPVIVGLPTVRSRLARVVTP